MFHNLFFSQKQIKTEAKVKMPKGNHAKPYMFLKRHLLITAYQ